MKNIFVNGFLCFVVFVFSFQIREEKCEMHTCFNLCVNLFRPCLISLIWNRMFVCVLLCFMLSPAIVVEHLRKASVMFETSNIVKNHMFVIIVVCAPTFFRSTPGEVYR